MSSIKRAQEESEDDDSPALGLLGGVTAHHIRLLAENPWNGGGGYTLEEVGNMTLDQIWSRLCDINILKKPIGERSSKIKALNVPGNIGDKQGNVVARDKDGKVIKMRKSTGESKAAMLKNGTYEGYVIDAETGLRKYVSPNKRRQRRKNKQLEHERREKQNGT